MQRLTRVTYAPSCSDGGLFRGAIVRRGDLWRQLEHITKYCRADLQHQLPYIEVDLIAGLKNKIPLATGENWRSLAEKDWAHLGRVEERPNRESYEGRGDLEVYLSSGIR
jgi:hypothetical protein